MRMVAMALSLLLSVPAHAGGLGLIATGGIHTEPVYYYSSVSPDGEEYKDIGDYDQFKMTQFLPQAGAGVNLVLGDRDDKIVGDARFFWMMDTPQTDPALIDAAIDDANLVSEYRDGSKHVGVAMIGLSFGIIGDPSKVMFGGIAHMGSAFVTLDHTEYLLLDAGPMITVRLARQAQLFADATYQLRYRKNFDHSAAGTVGVRYMFD